MSHNQSVHLYGRIFISGNIRALTGLHVGKGKEGVMVGGVDNAVMRDPLTNLPYIPGSSLKGKLRSLAEKSTLGLSFDFPPRAQTQIHVCASPDCKVCALYGVPAEKAHLPTRLVVRDIPLTAESQKRLKEIDTDLPFTEVKYEAAIDRVTAKANPRPLERVPADSVFGPLEMILNIYRAQDFERLFDLLEAMRLLEDDYLGGAGSRGSGRVQFEGLSIKVKPVSLYGQPGQAASAFEPELPEEERVGPEFLLGKKTDLQQRLRAWISIPEEPPAAQTPAGG
jgi:CRISPR-associated protein Csm3